MYYVNTNFYFGCD